MSGNEDCDAMTWRLQAGFLQRFNMLLACYECPSIVEDHPCLGRVGGEYEAPALPGRLSLPDHPPRLQSVTVHCSQ